uniref:Putative DNA ligase domain protein n=1 Tax=viral metagenome TaxID=1070528 RepID=A0A6M3M368_9ZZZZ
MKRFLDIRNELNVELPRAKGDYLEKAPSSIWTDPNWVLEPKMDGNRVSLQIGSEESLLVGRHRQDFLKGVAKAGPFRCLNDLNPKLQALANPVLDGTVLDGELTEIFKQDGTYDKGTKDRVANGDFVGYTAWDCLFLHHEDLRSWTFRRRRLILRAVVRTLANPKVRLIDQVTATREHLLSVFHGKGEGAVAKNLNDPIPVGQRTHSGWWKLKGSKDRTVLAFVVGASEASEGGSGVNGIKPKPNGKVATFTIAMMKGSQVVEVGKMSALPEDVVDVGLVAYQRYDRKVAKVMVSGWNGVSYRFPRFVEWCDDKGPMDCQMPEMNGGRK